MENDIFFIKLIILAHVHNMFERIIIELSSLIEIVKIILKFAPLISI